MVTPSNSHFHLHPSSIPPAHAEVPIPNPVVGGWSLFFCCCGCGGGCVSQWWVGEWWAVVMSGLRVCRPPPVRRVYIIYYTCAQCHCIVNCAGVVEAWQTAVGVLWEKELILFHRLLICTQKTGFGSDGLSTAFTQSSSPSEKKSMSHNFNGPAMGSFLLPLTGFCPKFFNK